MKTRLIFAAALLSVLFVQTALAAIPSWITFKSSELRSGAIQTQDGVGTWTVAIEEWRPGVSSSILHYRMTELEHISFPVYFELFDSEGQMVDKPLALRKESGEIEISTPLLQIGMIRFDQEPPPFIEGDPNQTRLSWPSKTADWAILGLVILVVFRLVFFRRRRP